MNILRICSSQKLVLYIQLLVLLAVYGIGVFEPQLYSDGTQPSVKLASVNGSGLTALSWSFVEKGVSQWVTHMLPHVSPSSSCSLDILAALPRQRAMSAQNATISIYSTEITPEQSIYLGPCRFTSIPVGWERKPDSSHPPRPTFFHCPAIDPSACAILQRDNCNITLTVDSVDSSSNLAAWLITNSPASRPKISDEGIGVCTNAVRQSDSSGHMLTAFARYYSALEFRRVIIHDSLGLHEQFLSKQYSPVTYLNYTMWGILGWKIPNQPVEGNNIVVRLGDQDKSLTYTYCRFELNQLLKTVFIVDFDEFPFCPGANLSIASQAETVRRMISNTRGNGFDSVTMQRSAMGYLTHDLPRVCSKLNVATLDEINSLKGGIFSCFYSYSRRCKQHQPRNSKSFHTGLTCPATDNHAACTSPLWLNRNCKCRIGDQKQCILLHLNGAKCVLKEINSQGMKNTTNELALMIESVKPFSTHSNIVNQSDEVNYGYLSIDNASNDDSGTLVNSSLADFPLYNTSNVHIFFILTPNFSSVSRYNDRYRNVQSFIKKDSHAKYFTALYWQAHWNIIKNTYKSFRLPNAHMPEMRGSRNRRGKYARWISVLLAVAYAVQFRLPHIVLLEDDSRWPSGDLRFN